VPTNQCAGTRGEEEWWGGERGKKCEKDGEINRRDTRLGGREREVTEGKSQIPTKFLLFI